MVTADVAVPGGQLVLRVEVVHHHVVLRGQVRHAADVGHRLVRVADHAAYVPGHDARTTSCSLETKQRIKTFIVIFLLN